MESKSCRSLTRQNKHADRMLMCDTGNMVEEPTQTTVLFLFEITITTQQKDKVVNAQYVSL